MSSGLLATLPVHLACQLITPANYSLDNYTLAADPPSTKKATVIPDGYTAFPDVGVAMKYFAGNLSWNMARKHCITEGGNLAVIDSLAKGRYADALRKSNPRGAFLGIHKLFDGSEWVSVKTGLPMPFIAWKGGLDHSAAAPSCTVLWADDGGRVGAADCNLQWTYTCEIPIFQD